MNLIRLSIDWIATRLRVEVGQDLIEYALLGGLIGGALIAAGVLTGLSAGLTSMADGIGECIDFDSGTDCTP